MKSLCYQLNIDRIKAIIENIFKAAKHLEALYENNASARLIDILLSFKDCNGILPFLHAGRIMKRKSFWSAAQKYILQETSVEEAKWIKVFCNATFRPSCTLPFCLDLLTLRITFALHSIQRMRQKLLAQTTTRNMNGVCSGEKSDPYSIRIRFREKFSSSYACEYLTEIQSFEVSKSVSHVAMCCM